MTSDRIKTQPDQNTDDKLDVQDFHFSNRQYELLWQDIEQKLRKLKHQYITPTLRTKSALQAIKILTQTQFVGNTLVGNRVSASLLSIISQYKAQVREKQISPKLIRQAKDLIHSHPTNCIVSNLAQQLIQFTEQYQSTNEYGSKYQNKEELVRVEQDIQMKKEFLRKYLQQMYQDDEDFHSRQITPNKQQQKKQIEKHSLTPTKTIKKPTIQIDKQNTTPRAHIRTPISKHNQLSNFNTQELKKQIQECDRQIKKLKATESQLKWQAVREVKQVTKQMEKEQLKRELMWSQEQSRKQKALKEEQGKSERNFIQDNNHFKVNMITPRTLNQLSIQSHLDHSFNEERVEGEYQSLRSILKMKVREKQEVQKDVSHTQRLLSRKRNV